MTWRRGGERATGKEPTAFAATWSRAVESEGKKKGRKHWDEKMKGRRFNIQIMGRGGDKKNKMRNEKKPQEQRGISQHFQAYLAAFQTHSLPGQKVAVARTHVVCRPPKRQRRRTRTAEEERAAEAVEPPPPVGGSAGFYCVTRRDTKMQREKSTNASGAEK